jgi:hypothetical protein
MFKDNLSFMYSIMESLRKEIEQEMKRTRLDKARLYDLLLKIIDNSGSGGAGGAGPQGPAGPTGVKGPAGPAGPAGECKCKCDAKAPAPAPVAKAPETAPVADAKAPPKTATVTKKVLVKKKVVTA